MIKLYQGEDDAFIYKNLNCKKIKGSHLLVISCGYCKTDIVKYQKKGKGNVLRLHIDRITKGTIDFSKGSPKCLTCPECQERLGTKVKSNKNKEVYKMIRSTFNTKEVK